MSATPHVTPIEPLFAHSGRLWLRVWLVTQLLATIIAATVELERDGPSAALARLVVAIFAYHIAGGAGHEWILRRTWAVLVFVALSWVLILSGLRVNAAFALLALGAIIEGFIFLSFAWAAVTLAIVVALLAYGVAVGARALPAGEGLMRVGMVLATGVMIATVLLYIHRANRETALRTRLLAQLDAAQRDLADRAREAGVLDERRRLSRDIHDTLAQAFTSILKHLEAVELALGDADVRTDRIRPHLRHAQDVSRTSLREVRQVLHELRPVVLNEAPLVGALGRVVEQWGMANGVATTFSAEPLPALLPDAEVTLLRAMQEALSNVARHAHATRVSASIAVVDELILLTIEDDGCGFAHVDSVAVEKLGLSGMRERVRRFGGHLMIESAPGTGASVTVALPLAAIVVAEDP